MSVSEFTHEDLDFMKESCDEELFFPVHDDSLSLDVYDKNPRLITLLSKVDDGPDPTNNSESTPQFLGDRAGGVSSWHGACTLRDFEGNFPTSTGSPAGILHLKLPTREKKSGPVTGSGVDSGGDFTIVGRLEGTLLVFDQKHVSSVVEVRRWQGTMNQTRNEIDGSWGVATTPKDNFDDLLDESEITSRFHLREIPFWIPYLEPVPGSPPSNRILLLWDFAIRTVLHLVRISTGHFSWRYLNYRREVRKRFLELYSRLSDESFSWIPYHARQSLSTSESEELAKISVLCSNSDLQFYRKLCVALQRRRTFQWWVFVILPLTY